MESYRPASALAVYLSSITGFIDALGFLYRRLLPSFMSGNTTRLTAAFAEGAWEVPPASWPCSWSA